MKHTTLQTTRYRGRTAVLSALLLSVAMLLATNGCDSNPTEAQDFNPEASLYAWIQTDTPVDTIRLEWTGKYNKYYDRSDLGIMNADIVMFPIYDADSAAVDTNAHPEYVLRFMHAPGRDGYGDYIPVDPNYTPRGQWTYRIEAKKPSEDVDVWAETTVPETFSFFAAYKSSPLDSINFDGDTLTREDDEIFINWDKSEDAGGYVLGIIADTPRDELIPLDPEWDPNDPNDQFEDYELNRHNWTTARDDQRTLTVAWIYFQWSGWNTLYISAASTSYYKYMFSLMRAQDPSWKQNPDFNVHGGIGVFGAYYRHEFHVYLERVQL